MGGAAMKRSEYAKESGTDHWEVSPDSKPSANFAMATPLNPCPFPNSVACPRRLPPAAWMAKP
jgi:hypothetical protein